MVINKWDTIHVTYFKFHTEDQKVKYTDPQHLLQGQARIEGA